MSTIVDTGDLLQKNRQAADEFDADRRYFLKTGLKAGLFMTAALGFWMPALTPAKAGTLGSRTLRLTNIHTNERFHGEYWRDGRYLPDAFGDIKTVMRDHRTGERFPIDPRLMDIMFVMQYRLDNHEPYEVFSGYRSEATNARLRRFSHGVARHSLHMTGQACDLNLPGTRLAHVRHAAMDLRSGGVGYYPSSDFVHVDTGRVRYW